MVRFLILILSTCCAFAQKTDALIPSIGFPVAYPVSSAAIALPPDAFLLRVAITAKNCDNVGLAAMPVGWQALFSEHDGERQVTLYPGRGTKLEQRRAVAGMFDRVVLVYPREVDDAWVAPSVSLEFEYWIPKTGDAILKIDGFRVVEEVLEPNLPPQRNAGSRPSSSDSSASETPSSHGPRG